MADGPNYEMPLRRRREGKTDYETRLEMLKSGEHRAVIRISNKHAQVQFIAYTPEGDETVVTAVSQQLDEFGWEYGTGNLPAAYLTGFLAGKRALAQNVSSAIPDLGVRDQQYGSRHYAAVQGLIDAGVQMAAGDGALPADGRATGEHIAEYTDEDVDGSVETVKDSITDAYGDE